jgi:hypothetical protein
MTEEERWSGAVEPDALLSLLPKVTLRKHMLFAVACCRLLEDWLIDSRSRNSIDVAEAFADGAASLNELEDASNHASTAAGIVGGPANIVDLVFYDIERNHHIARRAAERGVVDRELVESSITRELRTLLSDIARAFVEYESSDSPKIRLIQTALLRDIFGNPFRPVAFDAAWRTPTAVSLAKGMYDTRDFGAMPILADALQDAGCDNDDVLNHCRGEGPHVRGCWVVDLVLGKA